MLKGTRGRLVGVADEPPISCGCAAKCRALAASPGPLKTRAASGICHGVELVQMAQKRVPARRLMDTAEAGRVVAFQSAVPRSG